MYRFAEEDILHNRIKTYPEQRFYIHNGTTYYNNKLYPSGTSIPQGFIGLSEFENTNVGSGVPVYPFIYKGSSLVSLRTVTTDFYSGFAYGDTISGSYPLSASIGIERYTQGQSRPNINALQNTLNYYTPRSPYYQYNSTLGNWGDVAACMINVPSIFYGSSIRRGSVSLKFYASGTLLSELQDARENGELVQVTSNISGSSSVAGMVLYNEGIILLSGSWALSSTHQEAYAGTDYPRWKYFGASVANSSYEVKFDGLNYVNVLTMLCHAPMGELNNSNNPTFVESGQAQVLATGSAGYAENNQALIKNIVKSPYVNTEEGFKKTTFLSKVVLYDKDRKVIGIAKLATPVKKLEDRSVSIRLKLDI